MFVIKYRSKVELATLNLPTNEEFHRQYVTFAIIKNIEKVLHVIEDKKKSISRTILSINFQTQTCVDWLRSSNH